MEEKAIKRDWYTNSIQKKILKMHSQFRLNYAEQY